MFNIMEPVRKNKKCDICPYATNTNQNLKKHKHTGQNRVFLLAQADKVLENRANYDILLDMDLFLLTNRLLHALCVNQLACLYNLFSINHIHISWCNVTALSQ